jgi:transcription elongation factor GreA
MYSQAIAEARDKGDLSENAEYDAAKEAQGLHELKISKLEESISNARVIDESEINTDKVSILSKVKVLNLSFNKEFEYTIVSEEESDLQAGKISVQSPIGKGLLGKKKGEEVSIDVPSGELKFKMLNISL